jgi:methylamine dehydrogenase heavy chain
VKELAMSTRPMPSSPGFRTVLAGSLVLVAVVTSLDAQLKPDPLATTELPAKASPHWVWVNDIVFHHMVDGKAFLIDGDSGKMIGMLSAGFGYTGMLLPPDGSAVISPETYYSRGTRGTRTDIVTLYDPRKLVPSAEITIPAKRAGLLPMRSATGVTDDGRFLLIYNFTPSQSVTVVDLRSRQFVGEVDTPGCAMVYPTGPRTFFSLCGDGTGYAVRLDDVGKPATRNRTPKLFDPTKDPVTEKAVRYGTTWLFASFSGDVVPVETTGGDTKVGTRWSLTTPAERQQNWKPGGMQHLAIHQGRRRLYSLMHQGGPDTHKDPGSEIWVYDLGAGGKRVQRITLEKPLTSIAVTSDAKPLLFGLFIGAPELKVFDGASGALLRTVSEVGLTPSTLVTR